MENGIRPKGTRFELLFDERVYAFVVDADEALDVVPIVGHYLLSQRKYVHSVNLVDAVLLSLDPGVMRRNFA